MFLFYLFFFIRFHVHFGPNQIVSIRNVLFLFMYDNFKEREDEIL